MINYKNGVDRNLMVLFPESLDSLIGKESDVRVIDAFVESLELEKLFIETIRKNNAGARSYGPRDMIKLYLYGYTKKVYSSRKLMELSYINIEVMWLLKGLKPDFRSISDFRKDNIELLKKVFLQFNLICKKRRSLKWHKIEKMVIDIGLLFNDLSNNYEDNSIKLINLDELSDRIKIYEENKEEIETLIDK